MALGGTGDAAITLHANSVGSKQLKNGAVATKKIARNAVTSTGSANSANTVNLAGEERL
jgi:hypothetical protein